MRGVLGAARGAQGGEVVVEDGVEALRHIALAGEALHPDAVADQQVVERAVQRLEEGAAVGAVVGVGQRGGGVIEPLVAPGVVAGEHRIAGHHAAPANGADRRRIRRRACRPKRPPL